jgi:peptidyl-prolyl cis-trans isomerase D
LPAGATFGPYVNNGYYQVSKALGKKSAVVAQASHILIGYEGSSARNQKEKRTKEEAKAKAEEILAQVTTNPDSFMMLAFTTSDDPSAQRGGDLGEFGPNQMVKPFNDFVFNNSVGKIGLVETKFGFHIVKVTGKQDGIKLATLAQKIIPSESTSNKTFTQATQFEMDAASKDFEQLAKDNKLTVSAEASILAMGEQLGSLGNQRNIIRWAFGKDAEAGSIKRFEVANVGNVIVKLISVDNSGFIPLAQARPRVESILKNKKKAEQLTEKLKGTSLDAIAKAAASKVEKATDLSIASPNVNGSNEAKVVATAYTTKANTVSAPIEGISGVYVIKNIKSSTAAAPTDLKAYTDKLKAQSAGDLGRIMTALKGNAEIEDNRSAFNF